MSFVIAKIKNADRGKKLEPLRLQFEHCQAGLKPESLESTKTGIYNDKDYTNEYVAVCQIGDQHYVGSTKGQNQKESQTLYIALKHKVSNKVKLVEISKVVLSPVVQNLPTTNPVLIDNDEKSNGATRAGFVNRFGMLKRKRMLDQAQRLTVKAENFVANLENAAAASTDIQNSELALPKISDYFEEMLPPRKLDTKLPSEVYQIGNIISLDDMEALEENTKKLMRDDPDVKVDKFQEFSDYFIKEFKRLKSANLDKNEKLQRVIALLYTEGLLKFASIKKHAFAYAALDNRLPSVIPESVKKSILKSFSCQEGRYWVLSQVCREKIICHAIALALAIGNCTIDKESFSSSVKLEMTKFETLIRVVGARIAKGKTDGDSKIVLRIPLAVFHKNGLRKKKMNS